MATFNKQFLIASTAGQDLSDPATLYFVTNVASGLTNNEEKGFNGILVTGAETGHGISIVYDGISKFKAAAAVTAGAQVMVTTSGWITTATSGHYSVGFAQFAVASGSNGTGVFNFVNPTYLAT